MFLLVHSHSLAKLRKALETQRQQAGRQVVSYVHVPDRRHVNSMKCVTQWIGENWSGNNPVFILIQRLATWNKIQTKKNHKNTYIWHNITFSFRIPTDKPWGSGWYWHIQCLLSSKTLGIRNIFNEALKKKKDLISYKDVTSTKPQLPHRAHWPSGMQW